MNISIDNRHAERLRRKVESGSYPTLDAAVDMALTLLDEHDERHYTDETLPHLVEDVATRARERAGLREGRRA